MPPKTSFERPNRGEGDASKTEIPEGTKIKKNDLVIIKGTGSSKHLLYNKEEMVHRMHADTLIKNGAAVFVKDAPESVKAKKKLKARKE